MNSRQLIEWRKIIAYLNDLNEAAVQRLHCRRLLQRPKDDQQSQPEET